jgi:hypothetical protein
MSTGSTGEIFWESSNLLEHYHHWDNILRGAEVRGDLPTIRSSTDTMCRIYSKLHEAQFKAPIIVCHPKWPFKGYSDDGSVIVFYKSLITQSINPTGI